MLIRNTVLSLAVAATGVFGLTVTANASAKPLVEGQHSCTLTNPELTLSDMKATVYANPGSFKFTSVHSPDFGWNDTYLIAGYNRGSNSDVLCGHYGTDYAYRLPFKVSDPIQVTSSLTYTVSSNFNGSPGWDLWLVRDGEESTETTATAMENDHRTVEILVRPSAYGRITTVNGVWHRVAIGGGSMTNVNLSALIDVVLHHIGLSPLDYQLEAIPAGVEFRSGTFKLTGYKLSVTTSVTETRSATATSTYTARSGKVSATATARVTEAATHTVTVSLQGNTIAALRSEAATRAAALATAGARAVVRTKANAEAKSMATIALSDKLHPIKKLPVVVHKSLGSAISILKKAGFENLRWTRGLKPSAKVVREGGSPGHLMHTTARIFLTAKR